MDIQELENLKNAQKITTCFVDLDNTLWSGILAEGQTPELFEKRYKTLIELHDKGIQIYIISKNDQADVDKAFEKLKLNKSIFTWVAANWEPKFVNIERLIRICEIRPETAVFVDDNLFELNEVKQKIPDLHLLEAENIDFLLSVPSLASKSKQAEAEIEERKNRYRTAIQAESLKETFSGDDIEFYRKLKRSISLGEVPADNLDRAVRLLVETHRLNFNPEKFNDFDKAKDYIHQRFNAGDKVFAVATSEGEYSLGITGVLILNTQGDTVTISDGTFSCGIIGRDFEPKTLLVLIEKLKNEGVKILKINFVLTATNVRLKEIVENLGFSVETKETDNQGNLHLVYGLDIVNYETKNKFDWIDFSDKPITFDYIGHPEIIDFFSIHVRPLFKDGARVADLGSGRGEVLGLLQPAAREEFYKIINQKNIIYTKIDLEYRPEEQNIVANAEDLSGVFGDETQDIVMAMELLEHTQKPWLIISEMARICKKDGYLFISVPSFNFAKHEYPIDLWRFGPKTLKSFFEKPNFRVEALETSGDPQMPRKTMILIKKIDHGSLEIKMPPGKLDTKRQLTVFE